MGESIRFVIGEYTILSDLPFIYITDANNAGALQRNMKNSDSFTHNKVRGIKQGIENSIANHYLEHLILKRPQQDQIGAHTK